MEDSENSSDPVFYDPPPEVLEAHARLLAKKILDALEPYLSDNAPEQTDKIDRNA